MDIINATMPYPIKLEFDGLYTKALFVEKKSGEGGAKKKYALLSEDGTLILKGLEAVRGDWSLLAKETQRYAIESILKTGATAEAEKYVKIIVSQIKNRTIPLEKLKINVKITRPLKDYKSRSPHVAAAEIARQKGKLVAPGFIASFIIGKGIGKISDRVILFEDAKKDDYDIDYYINNQIIKVVEKLFEPFGYSEEELKSGQTKLGW